MFTREFKKLSIVIPVYNEERTLQKLIDVVEAVDLPLEKELIFVDDNSTDGTREILARLIGKYKVIYQDKNQGKGAAVKRGFQAATGDIVLIQDADLEYDPQEYPILIRPIIDGTSDVVYGSRLVTNQPHRVLFFWHYLGNQFLTLLSNAFTNLNLTDMETCYKMFTKKVVDEIKGKLVSQRFGIEPEITARVKRYRVYEVGISYSGRTYAEGKKIGWKDGVSALYCIVKFNLFP